MNEKEQKKHLRDSINKINEALITRKYENIENDILLILPQLSSIAKNVFELSMISSGFDFTSLFSYILNMTKQKIDISNAIYFLSILCHSNIFVPNSFSDKQRIDFLFSLLNNSLNDNPKTCALLEILLKISTPTNKIYLSLFDCDYIELLLDLDSLFPTIKILYNSIFSAFQDGYHTVPKYISIAVLRRAVRYIKQNNNEENIAFSLKLMSLYIQQLKFPINFNPDILIDNKETFLNYIHNDSILIVDSFLDFLLSYSIMNPQVFNEVIPLFLHSNDQISLKALLLFNKHPELDFQNYPSLMETVIDIFDYEPIKVQEEAFKIILKLIQRKIVNIEIVRILFDRIELFDECFDIIASLTREFDEYHVPNIDSLTMKDFFDLLIDFRQELDLFLSSDKITNEKENMIQYIQQAINHYTSKI